MVAGEAFQDNEPFFSYRKTVVKNQNARNGLPEDIAADSTTEMFGKSGSNLK